MGPYRAELGDQPSSRCKAYMSDSHNNHQPDKGRALYVDLPLGKHGLKNPPDANKADRSLPYGEGSRSREMGAGGGLVLL